MELELRPETIQRLNKHPTLRDIVMATIKYDDTSHMLMPLTQWFRGHYNNCPDVLIEEILCWDGDMIEDFWSWGHNSRWHHTFEDDMVDHFDDYVNTAIDIEEGEYDND